MKTDPESVQDLNIEKVQRPDPVHFYYPDSMAETKPSPPKKNVVLGGAFGGFFPRAGKIEQRRESEV